ncbi:hypothetical protein [Vibrio coralliilyticus]|uniref:hypothetical protein n=1 Tax=Vibrio coralliilyticus TaxID=190893 RepID=UPI0017D7AC2D|nr:hypothetical protein [Vibrio coralliilyticus]NUW69542.1 hypothetical protein [Vibrio coralliilyticus]
MFKYVILYKSNGCIASIYSDKEFAQEQLTEKTFLYEGDVPQEVLDDPFFYCYYKGKFIHEDDRPLTPEEIQQQKEQELAEIEARKEVLSDSLTSSRQDIGASSNAAKLLNEKITTNINNIKALKQSGGNKKVRTDIIRYSRYSFESINLGSVTTLALMISPKDGVIIRIETAMREDRGRVVYKARTVYHPVF